MKYYSSYAPSLTMIVPQMYVLPKSDDMNKPDCEVKSIFLW